MGLPDGWCRRGEPGLWRRDRHRGAQNQAGVDANESGKTFAALSTLGISLGVVGLAAGAYLVLTSPASKAQAAHSSTPTSGMSVHADLALARGHGFVSLAGRF
jgi:hypothetical protein